ncbi:molybdate transport system substrate-binding protein [Rhizobium sp. 9140]|nr:molybdate transport system substrate-binding protein [Rhizobium sp. 9140]
MLPAIQTLKTKTRAALAIAMVALASLATQATLAAPAIAADNVTVFAAASLKNALDAVNDAWQRQSGHAVTTSYAASSALAKQIEAGAPADIFISADLAWMDDIAGKKLIREDSRSTLLGNRLVLVAPAADARPVEIRQGFDLKARLAGGKLAMGAVEAVPAGKYGKAALESLGVWSSVEKDVAGAENVRAALLLVARGEAPLGIVYETDAAADPSVKIVATFPEISHPPIVYPVAILSESTHPDAAAYLDFVRSPAARPLFEAQGFTVLDK